jgi:hypothetical protein
MLCSCKSPFVLHYVILDTPCYLDGYGVYVIKNPAVTFLPQVPRDVDGQATGYAVVSLYFVRCLSTNKV